MGYLIDQFSYYYEDGGFGSVGGGRTFQSYGQSFLNTVDNALDSVVFRIDKVLSPTGTMSAKLYAHSGTFGTSSVGTGSALAVSGSIDVSTLTTSAQSITFSFTGTNKVKLAANTPYVIVVEYSGGDATNYIRLHSYSTSSTLHAGNRAALQSGVWNAGAPVDVQFEVYGTFPPANPINTAPLPAITIQKDYDYKVFGPTGTYLGTFNNVVSEFTYSQKLGTGGTQVDIELAQTEPDAKTVNNNQIQIWEYSSYYPNGILKFSGYISKTKTTYGKNENMKLTCLSHGQDLNQLFVQSGDSSFLAQTTDTGTKVYMGNSGAPLDYYAQTFTVGSSITMTQVGLKVDTSYSASAGNQKIYVSVYKMLGASPDTSTDTVLASIKSYSLTAALTGTVIYVSVGTLSLTSGNTYYFTVSRGNIDLWLYYSNANPYASGSMYGANPSPLVIRSSDDLYFNLLQRGGGLSGSYVSKDTSYIMNDILSSYQSYGGLVGRPNNGIGGTTGYASNYANVTYTFKLQTVLQAIQAVAALAPAGCYWYVDPAYNILYFAKAKTYPEIILVKGKHINSLELEATKEDIANTVYLVGGDDGTATNTSIFVGVYGTVGTNRISTVLLTDNRINSTTGGTTTARTVAQSYLDNHSSETYTTQVVINDTTMDINLPKLGMIVGYNGFGTSLDTILMQIVGIKYEPDQVTLDLGTLPPRTSNQLAKVQASLTSTQTLNAPITPS